MGAGETISSIIIGLGTGVISSIVSTRIFRRIDYDREKEEYKCKLAMYLTKLYSYFDKFDYEKDMLNLYKCVIEEGQPGRNRSWKFNKTDKMYLKKFDEIHIINQETNKEIV